AHAHGAAGARLPGRPEVHGRPAAEVHGELPDARLADREPAPGAAADRGDARRPAGDVRALVEARPVARRGPRAGPCRAGTPPTRSASPGSACTMSWSCW